jgi:hypothetical protein
MSYKKIDDSLTILTILSMKECALDGPMLVPVSFERINQTGHSSGRLKSSIVHSDHYYFKSE